MISSKAPGEAGPFGAPPSRPPDDAGARPTPEVAGWLYPGGARVSAPTVADPDWRGPDGEAHSVLTIAAAQRPEVRERLLELHAEAIGELSSAAVAAKLRGTGEQARALVAAASRLLHQLVGQGAR